MCVCARGGGSGQYHIKSPLDGITPNKNLLCAVAVSQGLSLDPSKNWPNRPLGMTGGRVNCKAIPSLLLLYSALNCFTCGFGVTSPNIHSSMLCIHSPTLLYIHSQCDLIFIASCLPLMRTKKTHHFLSFIEMKISK